MTLTIQDLGALGELLGSVAVLVTLVYLALQTRQNTMAISAQLDAARLEAVMNHSLNLSNSAELQDALIEDRGDDSSRTGFILAGHWNALLNMHHWMFVQSGRGVLPTFNRVAIEGNLRRNFRMQPGFSRWWDGLGRTTFPSDFVAFVEEQRAKAA